MDLREQRRLQTSQLIQRSALELARRDDVDDISVEAICLKAGISQRTFFNYFPYKEAAFVVPPPPFPEDAVEAFQRGQGALLDLLVELLAAQALASSPDRWMLDVARRAAEQHPKIAALQFASFHDFEASLAALIAKRMGDRKTSTTHGILAGAMLGALRVVLEANPNASRKQLADAVHKTLPQLRALSSVQSLSAPEPEQTVQPQLKRIGR